MLLVISLSTLILFGFASWQFAIEARAESLRVQESAVEEINWDLDSDFSFQKYLSADTPFSDVSYEPEDLIPIDSNFTANNSKRFSLREEAAIQFADMAWHFWYGMGGAKLYLSSAYRSPGFQQYLFNKGCSNARCAKVGASEHQAGLAVDIKVISKGGRAYSLFSGNVYYQWLADNAHNWGFHNTYQKGIEVDGQMVEGWHWRYVGTGLATQLTQSGLTLAEYFKESKINYTELTLNTLTN